MSMMQQDPRNRRETGSKGNLIPIGVFLLIALISAGGFGLVLLLLIVGGYLFYRQLKRENTKEGGAGQSGELYKRFVEYAQRGDSDREVSVYDKMQQFLSRTDEPQTDLSGVSGELFSDSERRPLQSPGQSGHDEYRHRAEELGDLLAAGIIEMDEYRDRMAALRQECR